MKYNIISIDCPWTYDNWTEKKNGAAKAHYNGLNIDELCKLPIGEIADENCALFMWVTGPKCVEGCHVKLFNAWGFRPVSLAFTWVKTNKNGSEYMGIGFYTRNNSELCFLGIKGKMPVISHSVKQVIISPKGKHSSKPNEEFRKRVLRLFGEKPSIDIFSREKPKINGLWTNVGDEVDGQDIKDSLNQIINGTYL